MTLTEIQELITQKLGAGAVLGQEIAGMQQALIIEPAYIADVCLELRNNPATYFDFLSCLTGVDYGVEDGRFGVIYHLASIPYKTQLTLKISREYSRDIEILPSFLSLSSVYRTADWHEREAYDLVGIFFENHPDLRRILMPDDWEGHPLRRDYQNAEYYKGIKID